MTWKDKLKDGVDKINHSKVAEKAWQGANKVGEASNKLVGKMGVEAFYPTDLARECEKAARILRTFTRDGVPSDEKSDYADTSASKKTQRVVKKIPTRAFEGTRGVAIFTVFRTGFGWSGAGGSGVVVKRLEDGSWSPPSGILIHTIGFGFLAGIDIYDCVVLLRDEKAIAAFTKPQVKLGAELAVAAGPVGNGFVLDSNLASKPAWSYTKSKGLYGGAQLDGTIIVIRTDENARFYHHPDVTADQILSGRFRWPSGPGPQGLQNTLLLAEGKSTQVDMSFVPSGAGPSDAVESTQMDAEAREALQEKEKQDGYA